MFPIRNFKFRVEIDGVQMGFSDVSGFDAKVKEITYREGDDKLNALRKLPGLLEYGQITLKRGVDSSLTLFTWINDLGNGTVTKKIVTLTALGDNGQPSAIWKITNAWPVSYNVSEFKGSGGEVVFETLVLVHEGLTRSL